MKDINYGNITICQECSVVFDYKLNVEKKYESLFTKCPVCRHEYELPRKQEYCDHIYVGTEDKVGYHYEECSKCGKLKD